MGRRAGLALARIARMAGRTLRGLIATTALFVLVAGVPWALWHYIGWPLPDHVPTWAEVESVLLAPMSTTFLLSFLACAIWIVWAAFTLDVVRYAIDLARSGVDTVRLQNFSTAGPLHALAGVLVGAVLLSVLGHRPPSATASPAPTALGTGTQVVATAPAWQHPAAPGEAAARSTDFATATTIGATVDSPARPVSVVVLAPQDGVHDSLWRIAERALGDGARWPEIFEINKGKPQPGGRLFTRPNLIFPGQELTLPADAATPSPPAPLPRDPPTPTPPSASTPLPPTSAPPTTTSPSVPASTPAAPSSPLPPPATAPGTDSRLTVAREPGIAWGPELFVGAGLAAAVSAALLIARRRYRARYRPGSGDRDDLPVAPVVYRLHLAHLREDDADLDTEWDSGDGEDGDTLDDGVQPRRVPPLPALVVGASTARPERSAPPRTAVAPGLGVRDGREIALDLASARGLGLLGAGALAAVRALLLAALTTAERPTGSGEARVVVPAGDMTAVLGQRTTAVPTAVLVVADLEAALDALEAETLVRANSRNGGLWAPLVLVARPARPHGRLQAVLDNGAPFGITGLLLGQWQPGVTCYIREDGTISATSPSLGVALRGTRMFRLGRDDTADLLVLLRHAEPTAHGSLTGDGDGMGESPRTRHPINRPPGQSAQLHAPTAAGGNASDVQSPPTPEPEFTAAVEAGPRVDRDLEILGPRGPSAPQDKPGPQAVPPWAPSDTPGEATGGQAPTGEQPTSAPARGMGVGEDEVKSALADAHRALLTITVLGGLRVHWHPEPDPGSGAERTGLGREITGVLQPRSQALLVLLALHPDGATRETLVDALWGENPPARPTNALRTALSRLRQDLSRATDGAAGEVAAVDNGRYRLDPTRVRVDYWRFATAVAARRAATTDTERVAAYREIIDSYAGHVADGLSTVDWLDPVREATRREAIDAVSALARALVEHDPQQTLDLLEIARAFDPHNELLYRDIMRLQARLGQHDAIPRTMALLTTRLAEVNDTPTAKIRWLAATLGQQHDTEHAERVDRTADPAQPIERGGSGPHT